MPKNIDFNDIINSFDETLKKEASQEAPKTDEIEKVASEEASDKNLETLLKEASITSLADDGAAYTADVLNENELLKIAGLGDAIASLDESNMEIAIEKIASDFANSLIEKLAGPEEDMIQQQMMQQGQGQGQPSPEEMAMMQQQMMQQQGQGQPQHPAAEHAANAEGIVAGAVANGLPKDQVFDLIDAAREQGTKEGIRVMQQLMQQQQEQQMMQEQMMQEQMMQEQMAQQQMAQQGQAPQGQMPPQQ